MNYNQWLGSLSPEENQNFSGKADCGCVYHAEEGIPCPHDYQLVLEAQAVAVDSILDKMSLHYYCTEFPDDDYYYDGELH